MSGGDEAFSRSKVLGAFSIEIAFLVGLACSSGLRAEHLPDNAASQSARLAPGAGEEETGIVAEDQLGIQAAKAAFEAATSIYIDERADMMEDRGIADELVERVAETTTVDDIAAILANRDSLNPFPDNSAVLYVDAGEDEYRSWLIGRSGLLAWSDPKPLQQLLDANTNLRASLGVDRIEDGRIAFRGEAPPAPSQERRNLFNDDAASVSRLLFSEPMVSALARIEHLVIVAPGVIATTPFAVLPVVDDQPLIANMTISIAPGLPELGVPPAPWAGNESFGQSLVVGDPLVRLPSWKVPPLPGARAEARLVAARFGRNPLIGSQATRQAVVAGMSDARVLYFATHGVADPDNPLDGGLLFLAGANENDSFLTAGEVQFMDLKADLAVLSACQTGLGRRHEAGVIGLARAFQLGGVPRVVMSLWQVNDAATNELMDHFSENARTMVPAVALRAAMLETRKAFPQPQDWGSFTLFGTPR